MRNVVTLVMTRSAGGGIWRHWVLCKSVERRRSQPRKGHTVPITNMIDARDWIVRCPAATRRWGKTRLVWLQTKPVSQSSPQLQRHERARVRLSLPLQVFQIRACMYVSCKGGPGRQPFQRGTRDAMQPASPSLLPAGPTQRQSKERVSRPEKKKKSQAKKKNEAETAHHQKARAGITPPAAAAPPIPPAAAERRNRRQSTRHDWRKRDSTARRRLQRH